MMGRKGNIGPVFSRFIRSANQPHWNTATVMPSGCAQREQAGKDPGGWHQQRPEQEHEGQETETHDDQQEPRKRVLEHLGEVGRHRLEATDVGLGARISRGGGDDVLAQVEE